MSYVVLKVALLVLFSNVCEAQNSIGAGTSTADISVRNYTKKNIGPVIELLCTVNNLPNGSSIYWSHKLPEVLSMNNTLIGDPSRYSLSDEGYKLSIRNALKEDQGRYYCFFLLLPSKIPFLSADHVLEIFSYLPPLNYPECSIEPNMPVIGGSNVTFNCTPGESNPPVNLLLTLIRPYGTSTELGNATTTQSVAFQDNNAWFICYMTSDTFSTVQRTCSAGPVRVTQTTALVPTTTQPKIAEKQTTNIVATTSSESKYDESTHCSYNIPLLIAVVTITIIAIVTVIILLGKVLKQKKIITSYEKAIDKDVGGPYRPLELRKTH